MIEIRNLSKSFGSLAVLKDINLTLTPGKTTVIIGPSGGGKSTLLRSVNLLEIPEAGTLTIGDKTVTFGEKPLKKQEILNIRRKTAMVFQGFHLFPHKTVLGNVTEGPVQVLKMKKAEAEELGMELLRKVGLEEKANAYPHTLSGGQQQRVAIARALAMKPEVLLFDEPTSALDPELEVEVLKVMKDLAREGYTMLIVTHNMGFAREAAHKVVFLDGGTVAVHDSPDVVFGQCDHPRVKEFTSAVLENR